MPVVSDFRAADVALGGQGAPLAPFIDGALFGSAAETRVLLNLGGIANLTVLPPGAPPLLAFDTGPANMVIDAVAQHLLGTPYDVDGACAADGTPDEALLADLLADPYFDRAPPKSTGREPVRRRLRRPLPRASALRRLRRARDGRRADRSVGRARHPNVRA